MFFQIETKALKKIKDLLIIQSKNNKLGLQQEGET